MEEFGATVRRSRVEDAEALVRLRVVMFEAMGLNPGPPDVRWRREAEAWFRMAADGPDTAAFVAEDGLDGVVSAAVGTVQRSIPGPQTPGGVVGHVANVVTLPGHRRRGHARRCLEALLTWFDDETAASRLELQATTDGSALYREFGFAEHEYLTMRRRRRPHGDHSV